MANPKPIRNDVLEAKHRYEVIVRHKARYPGPRSRRRRASKKLDKVHPDVVAAVAKILWDMEQRGLPMMVTDGARTLAMQQALYRQGRFGNPGPIVTYADGVKNKSNHQVKSSGYGHAVDLTFIDKSTGKPFWPTGGRWENRWKVFGQVVRNYGMKWGGDWRKPDRPHVEMAA
jgi:peptidoglycan L-alanyl-D-glutamate endopeptidase CwlK